LRFFHNKYAKTIGYEKSLEYIASHQNIENNIHQLKNQLNEVKIIMEQNVKCAINRDIELKNLEDSSKRATRTGQVFNERSNQVKNYHKFTKLKTIIATVIFIIILIIGFIVFPNKQDLDGLFPEKSFNNHQTDYQNITIKTV
jgi:hypothetical protein